MVENDEIIGVSLPPLEDINKGSCKRTFNMFIDKSKKLYTKYGIKSLNIAIPTDDVGNRKCSREELPQVIEIALVDISDNLIYDHPMCGGVRRFMNFEDLVKMINILVDY